MFDTRLFLCKKDACHGNCMTDEGRKKAEGGTLQEGKADARVSRKKSPCHGRDKNVWNGCFLCVTVLSASACIAVITENRAEAAAGTGLCGGRKEV